MISVGDILQVIAVMRLFGSIVENVYTIVVNSADGGDSAFLDFLADRLDELYQLNNNNIANDLTYESIHVNNITAAADLGDMPWPTLTAGATSDDPLPAGVAGLLTLPTNQLKVRGRKFLPAISEVNTTAGLFSGDLLDDMADMAVFLLETQEDLLSSNEFEFGVVNKVGTFKRYESAIVSNIPAYQRRRKQGVGA